MNKILIAAIFGLSALTGTVQAGSDHYYRQPWVSVAQAHYMEDDSEICLTGYLVEQLDDEEYLFQDGTGVMMMDIVDDEWRHIQATSHTRLTLCGELDQDDDDGAELDVEHMDLAY
ncbi:hypothetical protein GCM10022421_21610 [Oceanisphaera sediminis]|uniref:Bacterial OB-fold domain-containing protein n=1 Tax=Oceanisphaera sediminis TaxID=981381 RepID=A0ABP7E6W5_9GAMM